MSTISPAELPTELETTAGRRAPNPQLNTTITPQAAAELRHLAQYEAVRYVNSLKIGNTTRKYVLTRLADRVDRNRSCIIAVSLLAAEAEITERQVQKHLAALRQAGLISVKTRTHSNGSQITSRYILHGPWDDYGDTGEPFDTITTEDAQTPASDPEIIELDHGQTIPPRAFPKPHKVSRSRRSRVFARDGYRCGDCGTSQDLTVHHIVPWSLGGSNDESNLLTLCRSCNSRRGTHLPLEVDQ